MELQIPKVALQIFHIFTMLCLLLDFCTDCFFLSKSTRWAIKTGIKPEDISANLSFYINLGILCWLLLSIFFAILELLALIEVKFLESFSNSIIKPIIIIIMGFAHLGVCGDLGIASGILTIIAGVIWLIFDIILMV